MWADFFLVCFRGFLLDQAVLSWSRASVESCGRTVVTDEACPESGWEGDLCTSDSSGLSSRIYASWLLLSMAKLINVSVSDSESSSAAEDDRVFWRERDKERSFPLTLLENDCR